MAVNLIKLVMDKFAFLLFFKFVFLMQQGTVESHMFSVDDSSGSHVKANDDLMWVCFKIQLLLKLSVD